jgi:hypothetical protein
MKPIQWLTTASNPRTVSFSADAGTHGWRQHAVCADENTLFVELRNQPSLCGLIPRHGWDIDLFVDTKCKRCLLAYSKTTTES